MASLIKRSDKWTIVYVDANGKQRWVAGYPDKAETQKLAHRLELEADKIRRGEIDPTVEAQRVERAKGVIHHLDAYKAHLQASGKSNNHVDYTFKDVKKLADFGEITNAAEITWNLIDRWVLTLQDDDSPRTINRRVGSVKAFLRHLHEQGALATYCLKKYPKLKVIGTEKRKSRALSRAERDRLLAKAPVERVEIYRFALLSGFRFSEVASMRPSSFNFQRNTITVRASDAKNKSKDATIPMHPALVAPLKELCKGRADDVCIFQMPAESKAASLVRTDAKAAKITSKDLTFHSLRHTYITLLAESNIHPKILQTLARHSDIATTLGYYVHFRQTDEVSAIATL